MVLIICEVIVLALIVMLLINKLSLFENNEQSKEKSDEAIEVCIEDYII